MLNRSTQESNKPELPASTTKLIHSGKVLKDEDVVLSCGIKENDFLVVMATKPKKVQTSEPVAAAPASLASTPKAAESEEKTNESSSSTVAATPSNIASVSTSTPSAPTRNSSDSLPDEVVNNLTAMGFPEEEVRHCLRAAQGNPDVAVEFLTNGIPDGVSEAAAAMGAAAHTPAASSSVTSGSPLQALRNHPQFDALRRLVQSNPAMLQQVLTQIGQQQPELLQEINANQALFLQMMNEPVVEVSSDSSRSPVSSGATGTPRPGALPGGMMERMGNPAQMAQMIQSMSPEELNQMAGMMGLTVEQFRQTAQMIGQMPPEQLNQYMMQAMGGSDPTMGNTGGQHVLRLTEEEMAAVDRLAEMGFDRSEAAQAFLACDKNESLAANLLMDSMGEGDFGGGFGGDGNDNDNDDDDENMYD